MRHETPQCVICLLKECKTTGVEPHRERIKALRYSETPPEATPGWHRQATSNVRFSREFIDLAEQWLADDVAQTHFANFTEEYLAGDAHRLRWIHLHRQANVPPALSISLCHRLTDMAA